ncbi:hypothetical protein QVD99_005053 [Batrachochytrium dendrobatidis]|nr:hypothetical protein O5D80_004503 [Batrachochytrium dendrobatidis]KAK5668009.1 hypothetical protein QVD99_005053 [Batrachochytrium dendrobatidis]
MAKAASKKSKKDTHESIQQKFEPIPLTWPGKMSSVDLFSNIAIQAREAIQHKQFDLYVCLRIRQVDWEFHDFFITLPKNTTIYRLQHEIAKVQHLSAINPEDIMIYRSHPGTDMAEKAQASSDNASPQLVNTASSISLKERHQEPVSDSKEASNVLTKPKLNTTSNLCSDMFATLSGCFPEIVEFRLPPYATRYLSHQQKLESSAPEVSQTYGIGSKDTEPVSSINSLKPESSSTEKQPRIRSANSKNKQASKGSHSRPTSAHLAASKPYNSFQQVSPEPIYGHFSVVFCHDLQPSKNTTRQETTEKMQGKPIRYKPDGYNLEDSSWTGKRVDPVATHDNSGGSKANPYHIMTHEQDEHHYSQPGLQKTEIGYKNMMGIQLPTAVDIYYDVNPYMNKKNRDLGTGSSADAILSSFAHKAKSHTLDGAKSSVLFSRSHSPSLAGNQLSLYAEAFTNPTTTL